MLPTQTVPGWLGLVRGQCWDTADIAPLLRTQTVHRLVWPSAARVRGWGGNATYFAPLLPTQTVSRLGGGFAAMSGWAGVVRRGRGASAGIKRTLLPMHPTQTVHRLGSGYPFGWGGAGPVLGYSGHCSLAPHANSLPAGLARCGAARRGAGPVLGYNGICSPCTLRKQSPCWFGQVRRGCGDVGVGLFCAAIPPWGCLALPALECGWMVRVN